MWLERFLHLVLSMLLLSAILLFPVVATHADEGSIQIKSVSVTAVDEGYQLNVDSEIMLNSTLEQALEKGIMLYFVIRFGLVEPHWYWFDEEVARSKLRVGLRYYALTRQYHLSHGSFSQSFYTLKEALQVLSKFEQPIEAKSELKQGVDYIATLRVWLDLARLPKPFQVETLGSKEWNLSSDRLEWRMRLPLPTQPFHFRGSQ